MSSLSKDQLKDMIARTQARYSQIEHANWDPKTSTYRNSHTSMWEQAAREVAGSHWAEVVRVLASGESYYGGNY
jgi:hypothetical protein